MKQLRRIKPGWYVLLALLIYSIIITLSWQRSQKKLNQLSEGQITTSGEVIRPRTDGLWMPIAGAKIPSSAAYLPNAARTYRQGRSQGFDFYDGDAGIPISYGTAVIAADDGVLERIDHSYEELSPETWDSLLAQVAQGATEEQLDKLRGRQVWVKNFEGVTLRYAHLSAVREGLSVNSRIFRGQVLGYVGNSGTDNGVKNNQNGARLHFEIFYPDGSYFGQDLDAENVRIKAAGLFVGP
ncbi:MAG: M23 family metallopeptidase [Deinococcales bacterium]